MVITNVFFTQLSVHLEVSTYDARLFKESSIYSDIINGNGIPDRVVQLGDIGEIPLVTIGDSHFPQFAWLIKAYNETTRDNQKRYFNKRLCGTRVVTENAYDMLKGRWCIALKKTECQLFNLRYIVMACIAFHNLCIEISDPCQPRWRLEVDDLDLIRKRLRRAEDKREKERERERERERESLV